MKNKPMRVLQILPALNFCGGIENYVMNYYRHIDREKIQFDFITHTNLECSFKEEIVGMGGRIYEFPLFTISSLPSILKKIDSFMCEHKDEYEIIHCHMANAACFYFWKAKKYGIKNCILHSHLSSGADKVAHKLRNLPLMILGDCMASERVACSKLAGKFMFKSKNFKVIRNAIEFEKFKFNNEVRDKIRNKLGIENKFVIGHVGRFAPVKNHKFLVDVFCEVVKKKEAVLLMIGDGEEKDNIKELVIDKGIVDNVIFMDTCHNVNEYYQAFDVFLLPSWNEGLPVVGVEAQASGLPCVFSDTISREVLITRNCEMLSLDLDPKKWSETILLMCLHREDSYNSILLNGYDIEREAYNLESMYFKE